MSKPRKHMDDGTGQALCGRIVLDKTMIIDDVDTVTCPQCLKKMNEMIEGSHDNENA